MILSAAGFCRRVRAPIFWRYFVVSAGALCVDISCLLILRKWLELAMLAGGISYVIGSLFHYAVSTHAVFSERRRDWLRDKRWLEYLGWLLCAMSGLLLTAVVLYVGADVWGLPLLYVKGVAVPFSFFTVYLMKSRIIFPARKRR